MKTILKIGTTAALICVSALLFISYSEISFSTNTMNIIYIICNSVFLLTLISGIVVFAKKNSLICAYNVVLLLFGLFAISLWYIFDTPSYLLMAVWDVSLFYYMSYALFSKKVNQ